MRAFLRCLLLTGARPGELLRASVGRRRLRRRAHQSRRQSKTGDDDPRAVTGIAITPPVEQALRALEADRGQPLRVRLAAEAGRSRCTTTATRGGGSSKAAGITGQDAVAYTARHTVGTFAGSALPLNVVSGLLGHKNPTTTRRYATTRRTRSRAARRPWRRRSRRGSKATPRRRRGEEATQASALRAQRRKRVVQTHGGDARTPIRARRERPREARRGRTRRC